MDNWELCSGVLPKPLYICKQLGLKTSISLTHGANESKISD